MVKKPFESKLQDLVYNIDAGIGLRLIQVLLGFLALVVVLVLPFTALQFKGLKDPEAMDCAQLGRNLMQQKRFVTQVVRPASLQFMTQHSPSHRPAVERHPDLFHAPVYPALLAGVFSLYPPALAPDQKPGSITPEQVMIVPLNHIFVLLTGAWVFLIGRRLFTPRVALLGVAAYYLSRLVWDDSITGDGMPVVGFFAAGAFYLSIVSVDARRAGLAAGRWIAPMAGSAVFCVLAILTRYAAVWIVPGILLYLGLSFGRAGRVALPVFALVVLLGVSPWLVRNKAVSGSFFGMAPYTALYDSRLSDGDSLARTTHVPLKAGAVVNALQVKWLTKMSEYYRGRMGSLGEGLLVPFFFATFFFRFVRREVNLLRWALALAMAGMFFAAGLFGDPVFRLLHVFWPLMILYGFAFFFLLLDRLAFEARLANFAVGGAVVALSALPLISGLLPPRPGLPYPPYFPTFIQKVCSHLEPNEVMCTDMPWATAWYGSRVSIYLPTSVEEFYQINDYQKTIKGLYFTTLTRDLPYARVLKTGAYKTWFPILEGRIPSDFPLTQGFHLNNLDQLFLTDRPRWTETR